MLLNTSEKAVGFFVRDEIKIVEESQRFNHYLVGKKKTEVFYIYNKKLGVMEWSCASLSDDKRWSCSMFTGDKTEVSCSHQKAVKHFRNRIKFKTKRKESIVEKIERRKKIRQEKD